MEVTLGYTKAGEGNTQACLVFTSSSSSLIVSLCFSFYFSSVFVYLFLPFVLPHPSPSLHVFILSFISSSL